MAHLIKHTFSVKASSGGDYEGYSDTPFNGLVAGISYVYSTSAKMASTGTVEFTGAESGDRILSRTLSTGNWRVAPSLEAVDTTGGSISDSFTPVPICRERVKIKLADAGSSDEGVFHVYIDGGNN